MGKLVVNKKLVTPENAKTLINLCPFNAISYENDTLEISSALFFY